MATLAASTRRAFRNSRCILRVFLMIALIGSPLALAQQAPVDDALRAQFSRLFPGAASFSPKIDAPPHFKAFTKDPGTGEQRLAGYLFWTTDLEPLERGYSGPIRILVGMDTKGILSGIEVVSHREPYGDFSIDLPSYAAQFRGKDIRDAFRLGADIDAVSRATVTMSAATRSIRNSARRIARQLLAPGGQP